MTNGRPADLLSIEEYAQVVASNRLYFESLGGLLDVDLAEERQEMFRNRGISVGLPRNILSAVPSNTQSPRKETLDGKPPESPPPSPPTSPRDLNATSSPPTTPSAQPPTQPIQILESPDKQPLPGGQSLPTTTTTSESRDQNSSINQPTSDNTPELTKDTQPSTSPTESPIKSSADSQASQTPSTAPAGHLAASSAVPVAEPSPLNQSLDLASSVISSPSTTVSPAGPRRPRRHASFSFRGTAANTASSKFDTTSSIPNYATMFAQVKSPLSLLRSQSHALRPPLRKGLLLTPGNPLWDLGLRVALGISKTVRIY